MDIQIITPATRRLEPAASVAKNVPDEATRRAKAQVVSTDHPYAHLSEIEPGTVLPVHSHSETEVMIILSGSARIADTDCDAGSILVIPANTRYSVEAGTEKPMTFVVVRPQKAHFAA